MRHVGTQHRGLHRAGILGRLRRREQNMLPECDSCDLHLPALTALTLPQPASYKRVGDGVWSGGTYVCWGTDNREAPVRLCNAACPSSRNFELRFIDGLANVSPVQSSDRSDAHG